MQDTPDAEAPTLYQVRIEHAGAAAKIFEILQFRHGSNGQARSPIWPARIPTVAWTTRSKG